jgi:hypothetical protein
MAQLWGFTVKLDTLAEDGRIIPVHECRMEARQRRVAGSATPSSLRGVGR